MHTAHRNDLYCELVQLATTCAKKPVLMQLGARVANASAEEGFVELEDGTRHFAYLIVAGDGLHSVLRKVVVTGQDQQPQAMGMNAFRFLIPTASLHNDPHFLNLLKVKGRGSTVFADTTAAQMSDRHLMWYDCQGYGHATIIPHQMPVTLLSRSIVIPPLPQRGIRTPSVGIYLIYQKTSGRTNWPLSIRDPLPPWYRGKIVLIGDSAHAVSKRETVFSSRAIPHGCMYWQDRDIDAPLWRAGRQPSD